MRKQELIHLHALFDCIRSDLQKNGGVPTDAYVAYEAVRVRHSHIHARKADHQRAIRLLLYGIERTIEHNVTRSTSQAARLLQR